MNRTSLFIAAMFLVTGLAGCVGPYYGDYAGYPDGYRYYPAPSYSSYPGPYLGYGFGYGHRHVNPHRPVIVHQHDHHHSSRTYFDRHSADRPHQRHDQAVHQQRRFGHGEERSLATGHAPHGRSLPSGELWRERSVRNGRPETGRQHDGGHTRQGRTWQGNNLQCRSPRC